MATITAREALSSGAFDGMDVTIQGHIVPSKGVSITSDIPFESLRKASDGPYSIGNRSMWDFSNSIILAVPGIRNLFRFCSVGGGFGVLGYAEVTGRLELCDRDPFRKKLVDVRDIRWPGRDGVTQVLDLSLIDQMYLAERTQIESGLTYTPFERARSLEFLRAAYESW